VTGPFSRRTFLIGASASAVLASLPASAFASEGGTATAPIDAPPDLPVEWIPAPYLQTGSDPGAYGNFDLAHRPVSPALRFIVIHDTEEKYDRALQLVQDPNYLAWNYTIRSSDGHIAQHLETKNVGWHAGNWWFNSHAVGIEHEGYGAAGTTWFTEEMYANSARLVAHLAREYGIPLDRAHIIGHDQVPGVAPRNIPTQHWDPGPFWDWEHYFQLLGAPLDRGTLGGGRRPRVGEVVRILPGFTDNLQLVTGCDTNNPPICLSDAPKPCNFVPLHSAPSADADLVRDIGKDPSGKPATTNVEDIGARASAGTDYVVAEVQGDWTAVWYLGQRAWFLNPHTAPKARVVKRAKVVKAQSAAPVFGVAYPDQSAYADPADFQSVTPLGYTVSPGEAYAVVDEDPPTDYYKAWTFDINTPNDHIDVSQPSAHVLVNLGHRLAFVRKADVSVVDAG
jgi:hypothetical protein